MRGIALLLASICLTNGLPLVSQNEGSANTDYDSLLTELRNFGNSLRTNFPNFDLTYNDELAPLVSLLCAPLDYAELSIMPGVPELGPVHEWQKTLCSKLSREMRMDFSYLKECLNNTECFNTNKVDFLVGLTDENVFFYHYNIATVPKAPLVSACLKEDSCPKKNEATELLAQWEDRLNNCDNVENKEELKEAIDGISMVALASDNESLKKRYQNSLSHCLIITPSADVKRMMAEKLESTVACSEEIQEKLLKYLQKDPNSPMDVAMTVTRKLMSCDNETLARMVEKMLLENDDQYQTGYAVWETVKMMADERTELRKKRDVETPYERTLQDVVLNTDLQQKWNSAPFTWKYSYIQEATMWHSKVIYTAYVNIDFNAENPLATIRLSEVNSYPPMEKHVVVALESPLMAELNKAMSGEEIDFASVYKYFAYQGSHIPFKLSATILSDQFNYDSEKFQQFYADLSEQFQNIILALLDLPEIAEISIDKIGNTDGAIKFSFKSVEDGFNANVVLKKPDDGSNLMELSVEGKRITGEINRKKVVLSVVGKLPDETKFIDATLEIKAEHNGIDEVKHSVIGNLDAFSYHYDMNVACKIKENEAGGVGFSVTGNTNILSTKYELEVVYEPLTNNFKGETQCEMSVTIKNAETGERALSLSSCARPVYITDPKEPLRPLINIYRTLEIPSVLKLNLTLDFGTNGFLTFVTTPKIFLFNVHYKDTLLAELSAEFKLKQNQGRRSKKVAGKKMPMFETATSVNVTIPSISASTATFEMGSKIFEDLSAASLFHISSFLDVDGVVKTYDGNIQASSCADGMEEFLSTLMLMGSLEEMPEKICYNVNLKLPDNMGAFNQTFKYETASSDFLYSYKLGLTDSGDICHLSGDIFIALLDDQASFTCSIVWPFEAKIAISNTYANALPDLTNDDVSHLLFSRDAFFFNLKRYSLGGSLGWLDYTQVMESDNVPLSYALCTFERGPDPFLGNFNCDFKCKEASKMSISNDGNQLQMNGVWENKENGKIEMNADLEKVKVSVFDNRQSTEVADIVVDWVQPEVLVKAKPKPDEAMCVLVEYEGGEVTEDILRQSCLDKMSDLVEHVQLYLGFDLNKLSELLHSLDFEQPHEAIAQLLIDNYEQFMQFAKDMIDTLIAYFN